MRVDVLTPVVELRAEEIGMVEIEVLNDSTVIEQIVCAIPVLPASAYEVIPLALTLFPGESSRIAIHLWLPRDYPMGMHQLPIVVSGRMADVQVTKSIDVRVLELVDVDVSVTPQIVTGRKKGVFTVNLENRGNTDTEMSVRASDDANKLSFRIVPEVTTVPVGGNRAVEVMARGRRPMFGSPAYHRVTITGEHLPTVSVLQTEFKQKARITTGMITSLTLMMVLVIWAGALLLAARAAFGSEPPTKTVGANFVAGVAVADLDPTTVGGILRGAVTAASTGAPLPLMTVELYNSQNVFVTAVATGTDGKYQLTNVLPGRYRLRYRAPGFDERWYPAAVAPADGEFVSVAPATEVPLDDVSVPGGSGTLTLSVVAGDDGSVPVTIEITPADLPDAKPIVQETTSGVPVTFEGLSTPATYRITASAPAYQSAEITQVVAASEAVTANPITLAAATGSISGRVIGIDGTPLGDVEVATTVNGAPVVTRTPTGGDVGAFVLSGLPTPGTYVLTFTGAGYKSAVVAVALTAGASDSTQVVVMGSASGSVSGIVSADGSGLGDVTVHVSGGGFESTVTSFTDNPAGSYIISGLPVPGDYVITFSTPGRVAESIAVSITSSAPTATVNVSLLRSLGAIRGIVRDTSGVAVGGAIVTVSDGLHIRTTVSLSTASGSSGVGQFDMSGLAPGMYTVTVTYGSHTPVTYLVEVDVNPDLPSSPIVVLLED